MLESMKGFASLTKARLIIFAAVVSAAAGCGGREVQAVSPSRGRIEESFTEPAKTRLAKTWPISMPVAGRIARIDLEPGDRVTAGQALVAYDPVDFQEAVAQAREAVAEIEASIAVKSDNNIEETILVEAEQYIKAAQELLNAADEEVAAEKATSDRAVKELERTRALAEQNAASQRELDDAQLAADRAFIELKKQMFNRAAVNILVTIVELGPRTVNHYIDLKGLQLEELRHRLLQAQSRLKAAEHDLGLTNVTSPVDGVVLERYRQGGQALPAGTGILLLGNLDDLEVEADVLTSDALNLHPGTSVILTATAAGFSAEGAVTKVEPQGFTKLSSLGVEEQRVKTIVSLSPRPENLGVGFRVRARFITASKDDALKVPRYSVLEAPDGSFYVFRIVDGALVQTTVTLGLASDLEFEITGGLAESDSVVAQPDTTMTDRMKVEVRGAR